MDIPDIVVELMKYLFTINLMRFSIVNKQNHKLLDMFIKNIDKENFYIANNIKILNRSYELYPTKIINLNEMKDIKYIRRSKKEYALFIIDNTRIKIYKNII